MKRCTKKFVITRVNGYNVRNREEPQYVFLDELDYGVCPVCNRGDHFDNLANYCRYCGQRLEQVLVTKDGKRSHI